MAGEGRAALHVQKFFVPSAPLWEFRMIGVALGVCIITGSPIDAATVSRITVLAASLPVRVSVLRT